MPLLYVRSCIFRHCKMYSAELMYPCKGRGMHAAGKLSTSARLPRLSLRLGAQRPLHMQFEHGYKSTYSCQDMAVNEGEDGGRRDGESQTIMEGGMQGWLRLRNNDSVRYAGR